MIKFIFVGVPPMAIRGTSTIQKKVIKKNNL